MTEIQTTIDLNTNIEKVWEKLIMFEQYPKWNKFITQISGKKKVGATLSVSICLSGKKANVFTPRISSLEKNKELRWIGTLLANWIFKGEHYFQLEFIDENNTRFIHGEIFSGLLSPFILKFIGNMTREGFLLMNQCLSLSLLENIEK